ncbi:hypothetical protein [Streptomyces sp. NPDC006307]|uniref:hypothetical protein n=1 Tax=Streptomyces sp. NPDC006307 TaxID=3156748 RepID=UPI0033A948E7
MKQAAAGDYDRWYGNGTYAVGKDALAKPNPEPAEEDEYDAGGNEEEMPKIPPGTYRAKGQMEDCYWERTSKSGEILDNNFATSAREITVTIRSSDGQFTSERCAVWKPVK